MYLNYKEEIFADKMRRFIINNNTSEDLKKYTCENCKGTGLKGYYQVDQSNSSWSGEYCSYCKGIGFLNPEQISKDHYICHKCNGTGTWDRYKCRLCDGTGMINWLVNILE